MTRSSPRSTIIYLLSAPLTCHPDVFTASCLQLCQGSLQQPVQCTCSCHTLTETAMLMPGLRSNTTDCR